MSNPTNSLFHLSLSSPTCESLDSVDEIEKILNLLVPLSLSLISLRPSLSSSPSLSVYLSAPLCHQFKPRKLGFFQYQRIDQSFSHRLESILSFNSIVLSFSFITFISISLATRSIEPVNKYLITIRSFHPLLLGNASPSCLLRTMYRHMLKILERSKGCGGGSYLG
ncbi:hypothetical protein Prudu_1442S000500 [Prunus dulcis]|uniref:Uncharacterized protein n=1 Tax=Prunus dulcis TaxID=3755 RepID=A0A5H2XU80_PRUDU|nr:hypothetical protein Prudu_1442S000500 [Prunus dulcis]